TRVQVAAYLVVASGWSALVTWKWNALSAWINSFTPTHIIMGAAGEQTAHSLSLTFIMALVVLASVTVMLAFHTILAEDEQPLVGVAVGPLHADPLQQPLWMSVDEARPALAAC